MLTRFNWDVWHRYSELQQWDGVAAQGRAPIEACNGKGDKGLSKSGSKVETGIVITKKSQNDAHCVVESNTMHIHMPIVALVHGLRLRQLQIPDPKLLNGVGPYKHTCSIHYFGRVKGLWCGPKWRDAPSYLMTVDMPRQSCTVKMPTEGYRQQYKTVANEAYRLIRNGR